jgi:hypothetical protein
MGFPSASDRTDEEALRRELLRSDIRRRLRGVISDWPSGDQSAIVEKIVQSEMRYPSDAILAKIRDRLHRAS